MKLSSQRAAEVDAILDLILDAEPADRARVLDQACGDDKDLRANVKRLLKFSQLTDAAFLHEVGLEAVIQGSPEAPEPAEVGRTIGPYRLIEEMGRGGMGVVYLAQRVDGGFDQQVALKLSLRMDHGEAGARFHQERQILAELRHPNIAHLLDGGVTEQGQTYFALELVDGLPIDEYCDQHCLTVDERLDLFQQVVEGVRSAHSQLVVHRDIKPNNILVTSEGQAKLIDFGIAKLLDSEARDTPELTRPALRVMTPEFASPEQVTGKAISPASDIYQLGLLLYRLLTGSAPYSLPDTTPVTVEQVVCHTQPSQPSQSVSRLLRKSSSRVEARELAALRRTTPEGLKRVLRGDLDTIILKALQKEPSRRYISASDLLEDVRRYRSGQPVRAQPDTWLYRAKKFVGRNRLAVAAATAVVVLLLGYGATVTYQARTIAHERDRATAETRRAEAVTNFLLGLFERANPAVAGNHKLTVRQLIDQGSRSLLADLPDDPILQIDMSLTLSRTYSWLGEYDQALQLAQQAERLAHKHPADTATQTVEALDLQGQILLHSDQAEPALHAARKARRLALSGLGPDALVLASLIRLESSCEHRLGNLDRAKELALKALEHLNRVQESPSGYRGDILGNLGVLHQTHGEFEAAAAYYEDAIKAYQEVYGDSYPEILEMTKNLATSLLALDRDAEALEQQRDNLRRAQQIFGPSHPDVAEQLTALGLLLAESDDPLSAIPPLSESLEIRQTFFPPDSRVVTLNHLNIGYARLKAGDLEGSESDLRTATETGKKNTGPVAYSHYFLGQILLQTERAQEAIPSFLEAWTLYERTFGPENEQVTDMALELAEAYNQAGSKDKARSFLSTQLARLSPESEAGQRIQAALLALDES